LKLSFNNGIDLIFLLIFILLAIAGSMLVYYKNRENTELSTTQKRILAVLRATAIFLCLVLFLKPVFTFRKQIKEKPVIVVAADNSQSLRKYSRQLKETAEKINAGLEKKYKIDNWIFGKETLQTDTISSSDGKSDYSNLLEIIPNQYINKNIGALIILGDGIYNAGQNPLNRVPAISFPVYTVGFGDTVRIPDVRISTIKHNPSVFINNFFTVEADIHFDMLANKTATIELSSEGETLVSKSIPIPNNSYFTTETFSVQATKKGLRNYRVKVIPFDNEANKTNNNSDFAIDVIDTKHKILVISDGPHPDIGALKNILESFSNFEITHVTGNTLPKDLESFDMFVLNQLPSRQSFNNETLSSVISSKKPLFFIVGDRTSLPYLNNLQVGISAGPATGLNESQVAINKDFSLFTTENEIAGNLESFPPLNVPYTEFKISTDLQVLGRQKIKEVNTQNPLIVLGKYNGRKTGFLLGEGLWRWRIFDYRQNHQYNAVNELIYKIFNYLCLKENDENFKLIYSPVYSENEDVIIEAELYNDSYELINEPEASLVLQKDSTSEFRFIFDKISNRYSLNLGKPEAGTYRIEASVTLGDKKYTRNGNFDMVTLNLEDQQTVANHHVLYQLAYETGGKFFTPEKLDQLFSEIKSNEKIKPDKFVHFTQKELLNAKWLFLLILLTFGLEWFLRKYWGIY